MFLELIAVFVAGFVGAGVMLAAAKLSGGRLPRWLVPVGAGAAMLIATVSLEYSWFERTRASLPEGTVILHSEAGGAPWRPWSYVIPVTNRFWALNTSTRLTNAAAPERVLAQVVQQARWAKPEGRVVMVDCTARVWAEAVPEGTDPTWRQDGTGLPIVATLCEG